MVALASFKGMQRQVLGKRTWHKEHYTRAGVGTVLVWGWVSQVRTLGQEMMTL